MSDNSPRLALPYMQAAQAQKHVTHNEALRVLDVVVQLSFDGLGETAPPASPFEGALHEVAAGATGDWAGQDGNLAVYVDGNWQFVTPLDGWIGMVKATGALVRWDGAAWDAVTMSTNGLETVGVNTTADTTNRLAVASSAVLFTHAGTDHQLKINKASATDTASLLFQDNWSGRAEMGLTGNDDFSIKVSSDGSTWTEALRVAAGEQVMTSANMVGPVSAAPGIGSGVVETGTNANGTYTKFADGTMICALSGLATASAAAASWTFPAAFNAAPSVTATVTGTSAALATVDSASTTAVDIYSFDTSGADTVTPSVDLVAIGRCF